MLVSITSSDPLPRQVPALLQPQPPEPPVPDPPSHASPTPSPSVSAWSAFETSGQLSTTGTDPHQWYKSRTVAA